MLKLATKLLRPSFANMKLPIGLMEVSNSASFVNTSGTPTLTFLQKLSYFTPGNLYSSLDEFSRQFIFSLANDYNLGLPAAVVIISCLLRGAFFMPNVKGQIAALKMKEIKPDMDRFKEKSKIAQMTRNMPLMKAARQQLRQAQKKKGIDNFYAFINIAQLPLLITWFLSLRYIAALPQVYPSVTQSFLWVPDLSTYDPYFILPIMSACLTSYSIIVSPGLKNTNVMPILQPFVKYLKYLPFLSLPITGFFPGILNLYWVALAANQAILMTFMNTSLVDKLISVKKKQAKPQIMQAIFVQEKPKATKVGNQKQNMQKDIKKQQLNQQPKVVVMPENVQKLQLLSKKPKKQKAKKTVP